MIHCTFLSLHNAGSGIYFPPRTRLLRFYYTGTPFSKVYSSRSDAYQRILYTFIHVGCKTNLENLPRPPFVISRMPLETHELFIRERRNDKTFVNEYNAKHQRTAHAASGKCKNAYRAPFNFNRRSHRSLHLTVAHVRVVFFHLDGCIYTVGKKASDTRPFIITTRIFSRGVKRRT